MLCEVRKRRKVCLIDMRVAQRRERQEVMAPPETIALISKISFSPPRTRKSIGSFESKPILSVEKGIRDSNNDCWVEMNLSTCLLWVKRASNKNITFIRSFCSFLNSLSLPYWASLHKSIYISLHVVGLLLDHHNIYVCIFLPVFHSSPLACFPK